MTRLLRKAIVVVAVAAVAIASCYAPRFAHASMVLRAASGHADSHHRHDHGVSHASPCHEDSGTEHGTGDAGAHKYCCAAACAASAFIFSATELPEASQQRAEATCLAEQLRPIAPSALDPPPRVG
jgi:hypothetical protein